MFDVEKFIEEVRVRPILWNIHSSEYWDKGNRISRWLDVCRQMYDDFDSRDDFVHEEMCRTLITKWKSLRDNFVRAMKAKGKGGSNRRQYVHFNQMSFLLPTVYKKRAVVSNNDDDDDMSTRHFNSVDDNDDNSEGKPIENSVDSRDIEEAVPYCELKIGDSFSSLRRHDGRHSTGSTTPPPIVGREVTKDDLRRTELNILRQLNNCTATSNSRFGRFDDDDDALFVMSLIAEFKKVPDDRKLDAKIEMMNTLKKWQSIPDWYNKTRNDSIKKRKVSKNGQNGPHGSSSYSDIAES